MPQQPRKPTFEELLQQAGAPPAPSPTPGRAPSFEELLAQTAQPEESALDRYRRNLGIGARRGVLNYAASPGAAMSEILGAAAKGDFGPLKESVELTGRGAINAISYVSPLVSKLAGDQGPRIAELQGQQAARRSSQQDFIDIQQELNRLDAEAARDPSLSGRVTRGGAEILTGAGPAVLTGVATGGSLPAIAGITALQSAARPENLALSTGLSVAPLPVGRVVRAGASAIRRVLGRGAEQIIEAEAAAVPRGVASQIASMGPTELQAGIRAGASSRAPFTVGPAVDASANLNAAINAAASEVPPAAWKRIASEVSAFPRAMMSSLDISAPGRQGLILAVAPSRWGAAIKAGREMFQSFKPEAYERITKEIAGHADAAVAEKSGLYLAFRGAAEELFTSRLAAKVPGVVRSQRMYETYLDSLRMSTFSQYKRLVDKAGLDAAQTARAYEAAAKWINYATGRGSLGKKFDDAVPLLSQFLFAPRYTASRFNVLNPVMYYRNFKDPATRVVAKAQMADLVQYLGAVGLTMGLAKAAGLDVGLNPVKGDFLKIRWGAKVYDPGAGLVQVMRFAVRATRDLYRASKGEKAEWGQDAASLTERFIRSKLAPIPSYVWDFFSRRTYEGKDFTSAKDRAIGVVERVTPLAWGDFVEALWTEGLGGAAGTLPGFAGIGVQSYTEPGGFLDRGAPLLREYARANRRLPEIRRIKGEADEQFNARVKVFGEALEQYGVGLVESDEYRRADAAAKDKALDLLPRRISSALIKQGESWQLQPRVIMSDVRETQQNRQQR